MLVIKKKFLVNHFYLAPAFWLEPANFMPQPTKVCRSAHAKVSSDRLCVDIGRFTVLVVPYYLMCIIDNGCNTVVVQCLKNVKGKSFIFNHFTNNSIKCYTGWVRNELDILPKSKNWFMVRPRYLCDWQYPIILWPNIKLNLDLAVRLGLTCMTSCSLL